MTKKEYRPVEDQNIWNVVASVIFVVALIFALIVIRQTQGGLPTSVPLFDALLMTLAAFRITRLMVYDKITRFFREWFVQKQVEEINGTPVVVLTPVTQGMRGTIHDLLGCPWCVGIWSALVVVFCYFVFAWSWLVILVLAVAGLSSLVQITANMIGWQAEDLKIDVSKKEA